MSRQPPKCLQEVLEEARSLSKCENEIISRWQQLMRVPGECAAFLASVASSHSGNQGNGLAAPQPTAEEEVELLVAVYCAAALATSAGLFLPTVAGISTNSSSSNNSENGMAAADEAVTRTFNFLAHPMLPLSSRPPQRSPAATEDTAGHAAALAAAEVLPQIVERYLVPSSDTFGAHRERLARLNMALPLLGFVLSGYACYLLYHTPTPARNAARCLRVLARVVYAEKSAYPVEDQTPVKGAGAVPQAPREPLTPLPQRCSRLTAAHTPYLHVARVAHLPAAGLVLLLDNPVLRLDPVLDGVTLADYIQYYVEGATLLAELGRYADAAECLYNVAALDPDNFVAVPRHGDGAPRPRGGARTERALGDRNRDEEAEGPTGEAPKKRRALGYEPARTGATLPCGFVRRLPLWHHQFCPSEEELNAALGHYVYACKLTILLTIMGFGGAQGLKQGEDAQKGAHPQPEPLRRTHMLPSVVGQEGSRSPPLRVYQKLWRHASSGDLAAFQSTLQEGSAVLNEDGLQGLAYQALCRLRRFTLLRMAQTHDTVPLQTVVEATSLDRLAEPKGNTSSGQQQQQQQQQGPSRPRPMNVDEREDAIQLLTAMHEEGQLISEVSLRSPVSQQREAVASGQWVVCWRLPTTLTAAERTAHLAHRATFGNCACSALLQTFSTPVTADGAITLSTGSGVLLPAPSMTVAGALVSLRRADAVRAHTAAAEQEVSAWKKKIRSEMEGDV